MSDQPRIVLHKNLDDTIPHKTGHPSVQFIHPGKWVLTNRKLLFIWNVLALFVITSLYIFSEQEGVMHIKSRYAHVPAQDHKRGYHNASDAEDDAFPHWYSGELEWVPNPDTEYEEKSSHGFKVTELQMSLNHKAEINSEIQEILGSGNFLSSTNALNKTDWGEDYSKTKNQIFAQLESMVYSQHSPETIHSATIFISRINEVLDDVANNVNAEPHVTLYDIKYTLENLRLKYTGSWLRTANALLDGLHNSVLLDHHDSLTVNDLNLRFLPQSRSPCWIEVLLPGQYYNKYKGPFAAFQRSMMSRVYKVRLQNRTMSWRMRCLPGFFLAGFPKCGTTDLYLRLGAHPTIYASKHKEPHWWTRKRIGIYKNLRNDHNAVPLTTYVDMQDRKANVIIRQDVIRTALTVDGSASTIWDDAQYSTNISDPSDPLDFELDLNKSVSHQISQLLPESLIVLIVREPVSRLFSELLFFHDEVSKQADYHDVVRAQVQIQIEEFEWCLSRTEHDLYRCVVWLRSNSKATLVRVYIGLYYVYIQNWLRYFPKVNIKVVTLDEYNKDPASVLQDIVHFLGLDDYPDDVMKSLANHTRHHNARKYDAEPLAEDTEALLRAFYKPYNQKLAELLQDDKYLWS